MIRTAISLCVAALAPLGAMAQTPSQDSGMRHYVAEYRMYLAGVLLSKVELQLSLSPENYRLSAHIAPAGIGHILSDSHVVTTTKGRVSAGRFMPERLDLAWTNDETIKTSYMNYQQGAPIEFNSGYKLPPEAQPKNKVDLADIGGGSVDPFLAMLAPLQDNALPTACTGKIRVFDGRRLATLSSENPVKIAANAHDFDVPIALVACSVIWQPIAGYSERSMARADDLPPIEAHYGRIDEQPYAAPLDMKAETRYGNISLNAVSFFKPIDALPAAFDIEDFVFSEDDEE